MKYLGGSEGREKERKEKIGNKLKEEREKKKRANQVDNQDGIQERQKKTERGRRRINKKKIDMGQKRDRRKSKREIEIEGGRCCCCCEE